ncbi:hypothetical protein EST38_g8567 [Candolleomyces aberdarensis]|uniref:Uncharacterized protein n=1 Tax=Candolleomyces aberdarensis TaxID=2316362 RepID=A0A4Q2DCX8_9AGAR|nr:hypothetical protein EST38_g8567 [Candolleomyces aberdarensis]
MYLSVDPVPVLRCFHLPALKSLEYKVDGWPRYQKTVPKYFAEAEFKLTRLRISDQRLNEDLAYAVAHAPPLHEAQDVHIEYSEPVKRPKIWDTYPLEGDGPPWLHWARTERIPDVDQLIDTAHLTFDQQLLDPTDTLLQGLDGFV